MPILFTLGRVLFVVIFLLSGATKLWDIPGTAAMVAAKVTVPAALAGLAAQAETMTGMQTPQLLAILYAAGEIIAGLMIVFNFGARLLAAVFRARGGLLSAPRGSAARRADAALKSANILCAAGLNALSLHRHRSGGEHARHPEHGLAQLASDRGGALAAGAARARRRRARSHLPALDRVQSLVAERQARHLRSRRPGGRRRCLPLHRAREGRLEGLAWPCRTGLRHLALLPPDRADPHQAEIRAGRGRLPPAPLAVLQEDADRARLRCEAEHPRLHGVLRPADRGLAGELDLLGADHAVGRQRPDPEMRGLDHEIAFHRATSGA